MFSDLHYAGVRENVREMRGELRLGGKLGVKGGKVTSSGSGSRAYRRDSTLQGKD